MNLGSIKKLVLTFQQFLFQYLNDVTQVLSKFQPQLPPEINKCNGWAWDVCMKGATSVPKSVLHYSVDKVRYLDEPRAYGMKNIMFPSSGQTSDLFRYDLFLNIFYTPKFTKLGFFILNRYCHHRTKIYIL